MEVLGKLRYEKRLLTYGCGVILGPIECVHLLVAHAFLNAFLCLRYSHDLLSAVGLGDLVSKSIDMSIDKNKRSYHRAAFSGPGHRREAT